ncbi:hypothetical protein NCPPB3778_50 [Rathayibacter phage NCPPB3778]|nr:hypothetical protein NCPPB3778_50 [Rathayibacter phage NCPPB3778]
MRKYKVFEESSGRLLMTFRPSGGDSLVVKVGGKRMVLTYAEAAGLFTAVRSSLLKMSELDSHE